MCDLVSGTGPQTSRGAGPALPLDVLVRVYQNSIKRENIAMIHFYWAILSGPLTVSSLLGFGVIKERREVSEKKDHDPNETGIPPLLAT